MSLKSLEIALAAAVALVVLSAPAYAYLDPGTGSMILQATIGGIAGGLFILRTWWSRIVAHFGGAKNQPAAETDSGADPAP